MFFSLLIQAWWRCFFLIYVQQNTPNMKMQPILKVSFLLCFLFTFSTHQEKKACTQKTQWLKSSAHLFLSFFFFFLHNSRLFKESKGDSPSPSLFHCHFHMQHKYTHGESDAHKHTQKRTLKCSRGKWRCADCPLRLLHYPFCVYFSFSALIFSLSPALSLCLCSYSLCQVCASISYPHCPVSCHPFTRPSSLCHHQGPGGLLRSASGEKGLYLGNAPSNRSS